MKHILLLNNPIRKNLRQSSNWVKKTVGYCSIFLFSLIWVTAQAQTREISGIVTSGEDNTALPGVNVIIKGTTTGTVTDIEGNYYIKNVPVGEYTLIASMIGYSKLTVTKLEVKPGDNKQLDFSLTSEALQTEEVVVTAEALKNTEVSVLKIQKNSANIVDGVSSELISKNNSSDGTDVLKRMTGVTISEGKYAYVRGVGDRYNNTLLNGASLPSTDPEKKSFSYDIIPAGMIENVITAKTFTPDKPGDFSGGLVQINTVEFPNYFTLSFNTTAGFNSNSTLKSFSTYNGGSTDWLGIDDGTRNIPGTINDNRVVRGNYTNAELQEIGLSFKNNWNTNAVRAPINGSLKLTLGDKYDIGNDLFGYIASLDYSNTSATSNRDKNFYDLAFPKGVFPANDQNSALSAASLFSSSGC